MSSTLSMVEHLVVSHPEVRIVRMGAGAPLRTRVGRTDSGTRPAYLLVTDGEETTVEGPGAVEITGATYVFRVRTPRVPAGVLSDAVNAVNALWVWPSVQPEALYRRIQPWWKECSG